MGIIGHVSFPETPEGNAVYEYLTSQQKKDFCKGSEIFTEDVVFNGLLYKAKGRDVLVKGFQDFVEKVLISLKVEAVNPAGNDMFMALYYSKMVGADEQVPICDLLTMKDGKISRVDNCFNVNNISQEVRDYSKAASDAVASTF